MTTVPTVTTLPLDVWRAREREHAERADALTANRRERAARGQTHPVDDFVYTYYSYRPAVLRKWHPGSGMELADAAATPRANWRWYTAEASSLRVDTAAFVRRYASLLHNIATILHRTAARSGQFDCFGLHEWAMVYRERAPRHPAPLRLGASGTDAVVEAHDLKCTHYDAFRFFTPDASGRNRQQLTRHDQPATEQAGCLHAGMDLYKWAVKLGPLLPGEVLLDAFALAQRIREIDMRASPYDLAAWGYDPIPIEHPEGKAEYVRWQRQFAAEATPVRERLLAVLAEAKLTLTPEESTASS